MREWLRAELPRLLEVLGLTGLVITQPVLEVFQNGADVFVIRGASRGVIVAFALVVALAPALALWGIGALTRLAGDRARTIAHRVTLVLLAGVLVAEVVEDVVDPPTAVVLVAAGLAVAVVAWALSRWSPLALFLRYLALGSVVFVGVFLFASPVTDLLRDDDVAVADVDVREPAPVLMIVLDELPTVSLLDGHGRIDRHRFPAFAELAGDATWYRNHSTVAPLTPGAVPALLSGQPPEGEDDAPVAAVHPDNLFTLLGGTHEVHATETLTELCPPSVCRDRPTPSGGDSLRSLLDTAGDIAESVASPGEEPPSVGFSVSGLPSDPEAPDRLAAFADSLEASGDRPRLDYAHVLLPHQPYDHLPSGDRYEAPDPPAGVGFFSLWEHAPAAQVGRQRHLLQLQLTDRLLGRVFDRLRDLGTYDDTLVVVTADHGVAFTPQSPIRGVDEANFPEVMWTPLFVKAPDQQEGTVDDEPRESIETLDLIADELDVDIPWRTGRGRDDDERVLLDWEFHGIHPEDGDFLTFDGREGFQRVLDDEPLGAQGDVPRGLYRIGPYGYLLGVGSTGMPLTPAPGAQITAAGAYVAGTVDTDDPLDLVLVRDGMVIATPTTFPGPEGGGQFAAMIPDDWRPAAPEEIEVFAIEGEP